MAIPFGSLNLGIIDGALQWIMKFVLGVLTAFINVYLSIMTKYLSLMLFEFGTVLLNFLDFVQSLFRKLAGLDPIWYNGIAPQAGDGIGIASNDPILLLLTSDIVLQALLGIFIVAIALLFIATIVQMLRVEYTAEGAKNSKGGIIGSALKAIAMFLTVPVVSMLGIFVANRLLAAVDAATNPTNSSSISSAVFVASSSSANRMYLESEAAYENPSLDEAILGWLYDMLSDMTSAEKNPNGVGYVDAASNLNSNVNILGVRATPFTGSDPLEIAKKVDQAFGMKAVNGNDPNGKYGPSKLGNYFDYNNTSMVMAYYDITKINYVILYVAAGFALWMLLNAAFGLILRLYKVAALFIISPPIIALMPISSKYYDDWRKSFISAVLSAYGVIVTLNVYFIVLEFLRGIQLFDPNATDWFIRQQNYFFNNYTYLLFVLAGMFAFKKLVAALSKLLGIDDTLAEGSEVAGDAIKKAAQIAGVIATGGATAATLTAKGVSAAAKGVKHVGKSVRNGTPLWNKDDSKAGQPFKPSYSKEDELNQESMQFGMKSQEHTQQMLGAISSGDDAKAKHHQKQARHYEKLQKETDLDIKNYKAEEKKKVAERSGAKAIADELKPSLGGGGSGGGKGGEKSSKSDSSGGKLLKSIVKVAEGRADPKTLGPMQMLKDLAGGTGFDIIGKEVSKTYANTKSKIEAKREAVKANEEKEREAEARNKYEGELLKDYSKQLDKYAKEIKDLQSAGATVREIKKAQEKFNDKRKEYMNEAEAKRTLNKNSDKKDGGKK